MLKKSGVARGRSKPEVKRPEGVITDLQRAMGIEDRAIYSNCRVSFFPLRFLVYLIVLFILGHCL